MSDNNNVDKPISDKPSLEFQIYDWSEDHYVDRTEDESGSDTDKKLGEYIIHIFGRTADGKSVYGKILNFTPYFYIELPNEWYGLDEYKTKRKIEGLKDYLVGNFNKKIWGKFKPTLLKIDLVKAKKADGFTNDREFKFARLVFNNSDGMKKFRVFFEENDVEYDFKKYKFKTFEANLPPMFRCFHNRHITGCSWVETSKYVQVKKSDMKESHCDIEINVNWKDLNYIKKDMNAPLRIASFDIECFSHDGQFPQASRKQDAIIQIAITYTYLGQSEPYRQYIACLNNTDPFDNKTVLRWFDNEEDLILDFKAELIENDCDIITGYNIFYFDEKYIYDRCDQILGIKDEMSFISKLKKKYCNFKEMKLASSALGENLLRFWDTPGRVHIDLMKDVQKTFSLPCFKLDFVASNFIRGEVKNFLQIEDKKQKEYKFELECASVDDICQFDYIHLEVIRGFVSDEVGEKYMVLEIDKSTKKLIVKGDEFLAQELKSAKETGGGKIYWSQAKDDVGPKEIFKFFKGTPEQRSIVAKYCVKDCKLVSLLMNKLEIITKNIEMANVCSVPLSYLFIRGQGIKIFSLCLKEFKEQSYIFPVIKMTKLKKCISKKSDGTICNFETSNYSCPKCKGKNFEEMESNDTFEGAIVFDPVPTVDYEANVTKDYNSLYPSAIIQKNMSHETIVEKDEYDNLPDVKYYNAQFIDAEGEIQYRRYAQKNNKLGVIPMILDKLLKERKAVKKLMEAEPNPFKKRILDAKQLALKVTANSLYGQLGAATSPVCKRDIAACTTSTGREMLILGKKYDEENLPWLFNGMKKALENGDTKTFDKFLDMELKNRNNPEFIDNLKKYLTEGLKNKTIQPVVRYGDSVIGSTPLLLRNSETHEVYIKTIQELGKLWEQMEENGKEEKEYYDLHNCESWTEDGWTKVIRVIRHKLAKDKQLLAINTCNGFVVVTDEHSLLNENGDIVKPSELNPGDKLLHCLPKPIENLVDIHFDDKNFKEYKTQLEAMKGFQIALSNDIIPTVIYKNKKWYIKLTNYKDNKIIRIVKWDNEEEYVYDLTTANHHFQAGVGSIIVHNTDSNFSCYRIRENVETVNEDDSLELWKKIVDFSRELILPFIPEEYQEKWCKLHNKYYNSEDIDTLTLPNKLEVKPIPDHHKVILPITDRLKQYLKEYMEESFLPWLWSIQEVVLRNLNNMDYKLPQWAIHQMNKIRIQAIDLTDEHIKGFESRIKQIDTQLRKNNEKFKKETMDDITKKENESLIAERDIHKKEHTIIYEKRQGIELLIKNFINDVLKDNWIQPYWTLSETGEKIHNIEFYKGGNSITDKRSLDLSMDIGKFSGELIRSRLAFPHNFAYEKTFWPFLILCKKKYVGNKYEDNPNKYKQDFMGIVLKRRDNSPIVKEVCGGIIDLLINKRDPEGAKAFLKKCLDDMFAGKYDIKYFLQSRTLKMKESYKDWTRIAHVFLSEKIAARDPGNKPQSGDRIEFSVIKVKNDDPKKKLLQGEVIETPAFIKQNKLEIDYLFYMTNQIQNPATQFLELVDKNISELFDEYKVKYGIPKLIKEKKVKEIVVKEKKPRVPRKKIVKVDSPIVHLTNEINIDNEIIINKNVEEPVKIKKKKITVVEEPVVEEPVVEEPVVEEPIKIKKKKITVVEEPIVEEPVKIKKKKITVVEEPVVEEPVKIKKKKIIVVEEPIVEEPVKIKKKKTLVEEIDEIINEPIIEEPVKIKKKKVNLIEDTIAF
jgi:DNA polymerase elongation subunit (family B)